MASSCFCPTLMVMLNYQNPKCNLHSTKRMLQMDEHDTLEWKHWSPDILFKHINRAFKNKLTHYDRTQIQLVSMYKSPLREKRCP
jgi:hypothetical protein